MVASVERRGRRSGEEEEKVDVDNADDGDEKEEKHLREEITSFFVYHLRTRAFSEIPSFYICNNNENQSKNNERMLSSMLL